MNYSQIPEKPLFASMEGGRVDVPKEVYFLKNETTGDVVQADEQQAWTLLRGRAVEVGKYPIRFTIIGVGDGKIFFEGVNEARKIFQTTGDLKAAQERLRKGMRDECEAARGKLKNPRNFDTTDYRGNPVNIDTYGKF